MIKIPYPLTMRRALGKVSQNLALVGRMRSIIRNWVPSLFCFRSYSQRGEDSMVSQFIFDNGWTYIDVGSGHPVHGNDTFFPIQKRLFGSSCRSDKINWQTLAKI